MRDMRISVSADVDRSDTWLFELQLSKRLACRLLTIP